MNCNFHNIISLQSFLKFLFLLSAGRGIPMTFSPRIAPSALVNADRPNDAIRCFRHPHLWKEVDGYDVHIIVYVYIYIYIFISMYLHYMYIYITTYNIYVYTLYIYRHTCRYTIYIYTYIHYIYIHTIYIYICGSHVGITCFTAPTQCFQVF